MSGVHELASEELRKLQLVMLDMLLEFERICKKHKIKYMIDGGTLLGAVRNQAFIPWDDDVDVAMLRSEYEKFRKIASDELDSGKFFFQDYSTDPNYRFGYAKIRRKNSVYIKAGQEHLKGKGGIFIDVFPIDGLPDNAFRRQIVNFWCFILRKCSYSEIGMAAEKSAFKRFLFRLLYIVPMPLVFRAIERLAKKPYANSGEYVRIITLPLQFKGQTGYQRKWFASLSNAYLFEGHIFPGPADIDGYLRSQFGDYMRLPPESERKAHGVAAIKFPEE